MIEIIFSKLKELKEEIREKNLKNSKFRNKYLENIESSSAESGTGSQSPPKLKSYRLSKSSLKPKPQFQSKEGIIGREISAIGALELKYWAPLSSVFSIT